MNIKKNGIPLNKFKRSPLFYKMFIGIIISNFVFMYLFGSTKKDSIQETSPPSNWVEIEIKATTFITNPKNKRVIITNSSKDRSFEGTIKEISDQELVTLWIKEKDLKLLDPEFEWIIYPYSRTLSFNKQKRQNDYEIYY